MSRLFLLLLLAVDWAASPEHMAPAVRALAKPMASTECFCYSLVQCPIHPLAVTPNLPTIVTTTHLWTVPASAGINPPTLPPDFDPPGVCPQPFYCVWQI
jgi:hypothetical protein